MSVINRSLGDAQQILEHRLPFEMIYQQYHRRVYRYFYAHLKNDDDAADLTQQVFFQVWLHLSTYQPTRGSFATWLFSIAHHRLIDFLRAMRSSVSWETLYEIAITDLGPEEIILSQEAIARVRKLLDALSCFERELLALRFAARLSMAEIALIIGKSEEATKKRITRLIRRLQEQYRRQEAEKPQPDFWEAAIPTFSSLLYQVYAVAPPRWRLTMQHQKQPRLLSSLHPIH
jgi:RNA polymerase sigma-70 factor (ECF subfamily)